MQKSSGRGPKPGQVQAVRTEGSATARAVTRVISFTSGKGGVGKTSTVVNTAIALARLGRSVALLDADLGLANINVLLGLKPVCTIEDVLGGRRRLEEAVLDGPEGVSIIPAASGSSSICTLQGGQRLSLMQAVENFAYAYDYLLIDTQAGIGSEVMYFNSASAEIVCVINDEPTSLTDAYALIKVLCREYGEKAISILVNSVAGEAAAQGAYRRLCRAVERFLQVDLKFLGWVPRDAAVSAAVTEQRALQEIYPSSPAAMALNGVARRLDTEFFDYRVKGGMQFFFRQLLELNAHGG